MRPGRRVSKRRSRRREQVGQPFLDGHPDAGFRDGLVLVTEDVAGILDLPPFQLGMQSLLRPAQPSGASDMISGQRVTA
jgi:hypothetical protein